MTKQVKLALIGAGNRGRGIFGQYALDMPHRCKFIAVVEPDKDKREFFAARHGIPPENVFTDLENLKAKIPHGIDGAVIATQEDQRLDPIQFAMEQNWHILVEKPLCTNPQDMIKLYDATKDYAKIIIVCHQMRLTPVFKTIKSLIDSGKYGEVVTIHHSECLCYSHMAHSFVRGFLNNSRLTTMLLSKSCHDLDIISYLLNRKAEKICSFGALNYFTKANCPENAPKFCLQGCPHSQSCPYSVLKLYFNDDTDQAYLRQMGVVRDKDHLRELLSSNRFGKCVFQSDNDVVDNQTVQILFEGGVTVGFAMCGHNGVERRITKISMTNGEIECDFSDGLIKVWSFEPLQKDTIELAIKGTHGGGDRAIMDNFIDAIESGDKSGLLTPIQDSLQGHMMVFAAEESRKTGMVIDLDEYITSIRSKI